MPGLDGLGVIRKLRESKHRGTPRGQFMTVPVIRLLRTLPLDQRQQLFPQLMTMIRKVDAPLAWALLIVFYAIAKVFETFDWQVWALSDQLFAGHALKHIASGFSVPVCILNWTPSACCSTAVTGFRGAQCPWAAGVRMSAGKTNLARSVHVFIGSKGTSIP